MSPHVVMCMKLTQSCVGFGAFLETLLVSEDPAGNDATQQPPGSTGLSCCSAMAGYGDSARPGFQSNTVPPGNRGCRAPFPHVDHFVFMLSPCVPPPAQGSFPCSSACCTMSNRGPRWNLALSTMPAPLTRVYCTNGLHVVLRSRLQWVLRHAVLF